MCLLIVDNLSGNSTFVQYVRLYAGEISSKLSLVFFCVKGRDLKFEVESYSYYNTRIF